MKWIEENLETYLLFEPKSTSQNTHAGRGDLQNWKRIPDESNKSHCNSTFESTLQQKRAFQEIIEKKMV